jgi:hypothetical protein
VSEIRPVPGSHASPVRTHLSTFQNESLIMPSFDTTVTEIRDNPSGGCTVIIRPHELETTTDLSSVLIEPKFATNGGTIYNDHIELYCAERPPVHEGQALMIRSLDPHGE